mmetsp:Transcript_32562/g.98019  ORF Transcript_32562/g.98019 Transcript_32562/m.98019 type:complete len:113 (-) Transcript_32562:23-361(-)
MHREPEHTPCRGARRRTPHRHENAAAALARPTAAAPGRRRAPKAVRARAPELPATREQLGRQVWQPTALRHLCLIKADLPERAHNAPARRMMSLIDASEPGMRFHESFTASL